jgi:shikimate dehydrogenase
MKQFGLIGYPLTHSFSEKYFLEKFRKEKITDVDYKLFPLKHIRLLPELIYKYPSLYGLNVTVPYKESVIPYLDGLDEVAGKICAVNCIKIVKGTNRNQLIGFNTDVLGFEESLKPHLKNWHNNALILGTGGSSKAVAFVLRKFGINFTMVSRKPKMKNSIGYDDLTVSVIQDHLLIINTTPLGMFPNTQSAPQIPYEFLSYQHLLFDLVYNPEHTLFLQKGEMAGAITINGLEMLYIQAEESYKIWNQ